MDLPYFAAVTFLFGLMGLAWTCSNYRWVKYFWQGCFQSGLKSSSNFFPGPCQLVVACLDSLCHCCVLSSWAESPDGPDGTCPTQRGMHSDVGESWHVKTRWNKMKIDEVCIFCSFSARFRMSELSRSLPKSCEFRRSWCRKTHCAPGRWTEGCACRCLRT